MTQTHHCREEHRFFPIPAALHTRIGLFQLLLFNFYIKQVTADTTMMHFSHPSMKDI